MLWIVFSIKAEYHNATEKSVRNRDRGGRVGYRQGGIDFVMEIIDALLQIAADGFQCSVFAGKTVHQNGGQTFDVGSAGGGNLRRVNVFDRLFAAVEGGDVLVGTGIQPGVGQRNSAVCLGVLGSDFVHKFRVQFHTVLLEGDRFGDRILFAGDLDGGDGIGFCHGCFDSIAAGNQVQNGLVAAFGVFGKGLRRGVADILFAVFLGSAELGAVNLFGDAGIDGFEFGECLVKGHSFGVHSDFLLKNER